MMALTKTVFNSVRLLNKCGINSLTPLASLRTSAIAHQEKKEEKEIKWHWWRWFVPSKPEYDDQGELGYPVEGSLAEGMWKKEIEARAAGNKDPYGFHPYWYAQGKYDGTKVDPIMVPSCYESRIVSCLCEPEAQCWTQMWLHQNEPKRCGCGFWFLLYYQEPFVEWKFPY